MQNYEKIHFSDVKELENILHNSDDYAVLPAVVYHENFPQGIDDHRLVCPQCRSSDTVKTGSIIARDRTKRKKATFQRHRCKSCAHIFKGSRLP